MKMSPNNFMARFYVQKCPKVFKTGRKILKKTRILLKTSFEKIRFYYLY